MNTPNPPAQNPGAKKRLRLIREVEPKTEISVAARVLRLLFFASETAVVGIMFVYFLSGGFARYVQPLYPLLLGGSIGLLVASLWSFAVDRRLALVGVVTLLLCAFWLTSCPCIVE